MIIEGIECENKSVDITGIEPGDLYMAKRNTGWHLLTCNGISKDNTYIIPKECAYCYNLHECFKVKENLK